MFSGPPPDMNERANRALFLTTPVLSLGDGRAIVLLSALPDSTHPERCCLEATVVAEGLLPEGLRLVVRWAGGQRWARLHGAGPVRLTGIPLASLQALQAGESEALLVEIERVDCESNAMG